MRLPRIATLRSWFGPAAVALATFSIVVLVTLASWAFVPVLFGWSPMAISSGSMQPHIDIGDVVVVDPYDGRDLDPGIIVTYHEAGRLVTHRIVEVTDDGYVTKGDANRQPDSTTLVSDNIVGIGRVLAPYVARPHLWASSGQSAELGAFTAATLLALTIMLARPGIRIGPVDAQSPDEAHSDGIDDGPTPRPAQAPAPSRSPAPLAAGNAGAVWHAAAKPGQPTTPGRRGRGRRMLTVTLATLALTTVATTGVALSGSTAASHSWAGVLHPVTGIDVTAGCTDGQPWVQINWEEHARADGYQLHRDSGGGWQTHTALGDTTATGVHDTDIAVDNTYAYRVVATASSWLADPSITATVETTGGCDG